ncbi:hypothetical protein L218DRAFT_31292 [Marasmius fiardii PR-910]|nr:hypothetical protein L218DRAFT_31292 [Marasmius fiardii PR-910]
MLSGHFLIPRLPCSAMARIFWAVLLFPSPISVNPYYNILSAFSSCYPMHLTPLVLPSSPSLPPPEPLILLLNGQTAPQLSTRCHLTAAIAFVLKNLHYCSIYVIPSSQVSPPIEHHILHKPGLFQYLVIPLKAIIVHQASRYVGILTALYIALYSSPVHIVTLYYYPPPSTFSHSATPYLSTTKIVYPQLLSSVALQTLRAPFWPRLVT